ncbi:MAG: type III-A CRISPR-associated RAMP protein Csm3 [Chitinophagaceae bacterium]|nr:type III-A CRISPR-associated RAMP protein Csm3 [Chitinophagaceae bacterium]
MSLKLVEKIEITGTITLKTGLHIGGSTSAMSIGGIDKQVIRNPFNNQPYIPGSSLKGKMRSLFEVAIGMVDKEEKSNSKVKYGPSQVGRPADLFGNSSGNENQKPSRLIVRDGFLVNADEVLKHTDMPYTEGKTEVVIDRITSVANPRQMERVPAGAVFSLNMILNIWDKDDKKQLLEDLFTSLMLLKDDYLGGHGSRGYGHIAIRIDKIISRKTDGYYADPAQGEEDITHEFDTKLRELHDSKPVNDVAPV